MLTFTFLGVGSAFAKRHLCSNALVEVWNAGPGRQVAPDDTLLIDFGVTGPLGLYRLMQQPGFEYLNAAGRINYPAVQRVLVTHAHADHIGGLEELAMMNKHVYRIQPGGAERPEMISTPALLQGVWEHSLKGGLGATAGRYPTLEEYFVPRPLEAHRRDAGATHTPDASGSPDASGCVELVGGYRVKLFPTDHIQVFEKYDWASVGVFIEPPGGEARGGLFYSADTRFDWPAYQGMLERAGMCFHEVQLFDSPNPVHTLLSELRTLPEEIRRKTWLYHLSDDWDDPKYADVPRLFAGFAEPGRRYAMPEA
jgi:ribonuclease BN (tRNA processing enzyme)